MKWEKNQLFDSVIDGYTSQGAGVARLDGRPVFVPGAIRGETVRVRLVKARANFGYGRLERVLAPSPHRVEPRCPYFGRCGGCQLQHMAYAEELAFKQQKVEDALRRIGGVSKPCAGMVGSARVEGYRNKALYPVGRQDGRVVTGFYRPRSHALVPVDRCLLQSEAADAIARAVCHWAQACGAEPYDEETGRGLIRHVFVRSGFATGQVLAAVVANGSALPQPERLVAAIRAAAPQTVGVLLNENRARGNTVMGRRLQVLWGRAQLEDELCGNRFLLSPLSFYQVNRDQAEGLYQAAVAYAGLTGRETVLDLYCGAGTITLAMAAGGAGKVIGAEIVPAAVENARENARRNGRAGAEFILADAGAAARQLIERGERVDVICVDPPRKGMDDAARDAIVRLAPRRLVYVSCDPATLARDVHALAPHYRVEEYRAFDLFPRTAHVETVVGLVRKTCDD